MSYLSDKVKASNTPMKNFEVGRRNLGKFTYKGYTIEWFSYREGRGNKTVCSVIVTPKSDVYVTQIYSRYDSIAGLLRKTIGVESRDGSIEFVRDLPHTFGLVDLSGVEKSLGPAKDSVVIAEEVWETIIKMLTK